MGMRSRAPPVADAARRSRAPPVADAARRSIRSGRKNRASEQREDFFGHRKAARTMFCRVVVPQRVTLPSLKFEQAVICPDGPSPATGEGAGGAEPSAASGGCSEAEHPQRSKKSSKRAARRFFRAPQGGGGKCARGYLGSVSVRSTDDALASFVSSTASD